MQKTKSMITSTIMAGALVMQGAVSNAQTGSSANVSDEAIRPFHVNVPQEKLDDLKRRILSTKWPDPELVKDPSQGVQYATM